MKTSYVTVKTTSKTKKLESENREEQLNSKETLEAKENEIEPERRVEKDEDGIVFEAGTRWTKATIGRACSKNCGQEEAIAERLQLADKTGNNAREDLDGRDEIKRSERGS